MHLTPTNPVSGVWRQNTQAGVIPAISFTRLSRRNARISAHAMRMRAYVRMFAHGMRMRAFSRMGCECAHMCAFPRMRCDAMRCECAHVIRCECAHQGGTYACPVLYILHSYVNSDFLLVRFKMFHAPFICFLWTIELKTSLIIAKKYKDNFTWANYVLND